MTAQPQEAEGQEAVAEGPELGPARAEARGRASSVPSTVPLPLVTVTPRDPSWSPDLVRAWLPGRLSPVAAWLRARGTHVAGRELNLIHGPPPSVSGQWARHQQAAALWHSPLMKGLRLAWGALHTAAATGAYVLLDTGFSPAGALIVALITYLLVHTFPHWF